MYTTKTSLILGFHGCDKKIRDQVVNQKKEGLLKSRNVWDWLGNGIYFWENNPQRALEFAQEQSKRKELEIETPAVLGAVLDLGYCLDLLDSSNLLKVKEAHNLLIDTCKLGNLPIPKNRNIGENISKSDKLLRDLDCAVIEMLHFANKSNKNKGFDSVRGLFTEGEPLYENAGFRIKDHIQLCIRNPNCIKGYFIPRELNIKYRRV